MSKFLCTKKTIQRSVKKKKKNLSAPEDLYLAGICAGKEERISNLDFS